jgi:Arc/MetJ-type ribon-helix-helix transcriptional regulator
VWRGVSLLPSVAAGGVARTRGGAARQWRGAEERRETPRAVPLSEVDTEAARVGLRGMDVHLTPDQKALVRQAIESGRLHREEEAVQEALILWEERERRRAEILAAVDEAEAALALGEGQAISEASVRHVRAAARAGREAARTRPARRRATPIPLMAHRIAAGWRSASRVLPSTSVKRKATVPLGRPATSALSRAAYRAHRGPSIPRPSRQRQRRRGQATLPPDRRRDALGRGHAGRAAWLPLQRGR